MNKTILDNKRTIKEIFDNIYLVVFAVFVGYSFITRATKIQIPWPEHFLSIIWAILIAAVTARLLLSEKSTMTEAAICCVLVAACLIAWQINGYKDIAYFLVLILGAKDIPARKIIKIFFVVDTILLCITVTLALTGQIENLVYYQEGRNVRRSLGMTYPTVFAAEILYLMLCWSYLRGDKIGFIDAAVSVFLGVLVYVICEARMNTGCLFLFAFGIIIYTGMRKYCKKRGREFVVSGWIQTLLACSPALCCAAMFMLTALYNSQNNVILFLNRVLNGRLRLGKLGMDIYGISPWGQYIPMIGFGGEAKEPLNYFYIDSSYINALLRFGGVILILVLFVMTLIAFRAKEERDMILLWIFVIIALHAVVEDALLLVTANPFLWLLLTDMKKDGKRKI